MGKESSIGWTDSTFNAWWGCTHDGPECDACYAEAWAKRTGHAVWGHDSPRRFFDEKHWRQPLLWNKQVEQSGERRKVFVMSMGDVGERLPGKTGERMNDERSRLWDIIESTPALTWQLLTKRPQNLPQLTPLSWSKGWPENIWVGTTAGTQDGLRKRGKYLVRIPAKILFLSCEPMLERLSLRDAGLVIHDDYGRVVTRISWLIIGGESGAKARPFDVEAARALTQECQEANIAPFVKQFGAKPFERGDLIQLRHRKGEDHSEWPGGPWPQDFPELA